MGLGRRPATKKHRLTSAAHAAATRAQMGLFLQWHPPAPPPPPPRSFAALARALGPCAAPPHLAPRARAAAPRRRSSDAGAPCWVQKHALLASSPSSIGMSIMGMLRVKMQLHESMLRERGEAPPAAAAAAGEAAAGAPDAPPPQLTREAAAAEWGAAQAPAWEEAGRERFFSRRDAWRAQLEMDAFEEMLWRKRCRGSRA